MLDFPGVPSFGRVGHYERNGLYSLDAVLRFASEATGLWVDFDGDSIKMWSPRYVLFKKNSDCVNCGLKGLYFAKERSIYLDKPSGRYWPTSHYFHFNLYGHNKQGYEVMLTKDHILPRAHGGLDDQNNFQTMCSPCNSRKRDRLPTETLEEYTARRSREKVAEKIKASPNGIYQPKTRSA